MDFDAFTAGVAPGGLTNTKEIKILICYILKTVDRPLSRRQLDEIVLTHQLCNYFEFSNALKELADTGSIEAQTDDADTYYTIQPQGITIASTLGRDLPYTVREKAVKCAFLLLARAKREAENKVVIEQQEAGCYVTCNVLDKDDPLLSMQLYVGDNEQAKMVKEHFLADPELVYKGVLALLTGDSEELVKYLLEHKEQPLQ